MLRKDIKQVICSLVSELDFYFEERGFKRRKNGLIYVRKVGTTIQKIDMVFFSNPSYYQNVLAHIYPQNLKRTIVYIEANVTMRSRMRESRTYGSVRG